ncbi:MAG: hypothetical protein CMC15_13365 [Flavobacteriaceae bacterium]|nr:hypothetical protein [Flavobacteriaceae bacterium]
MDAYLHDAWTIFVAIFAYFFKNLQAKLAALEKEKANADLTNDAIKGINGKMHEIEKKIDSLGLTAIERSEFKSDITSLHLRINDIEQRKSDKIQKVDVKMRTENGEH